MGYPCPVKCNSSQSKAVLASAGFGIENNSQLQPSAATLSFKGQTKKVRCVQC